MDVASQFLDFQRKIKLAALNAAVAPIPPKKPTSWFKPVMYGLGGAAALAGGAYLGDKYLNHGQGMDFLKKQFQPNPTGTAYVRPTPPRNLDPQMVQTDSRTVLPLVHSDRPGGRITPGEWETRHAVESTMAGQPGPNNEASHMFLGDQAKPGPIESVIDPARKFMQGPRTIGELGLAGGTMFPKLPFFGPMAGKLNKAIPGLGKGLGLLAGGEAGWDMGTNPLNVEAWAEPTKTWWNPASWGRSGEEYKGDISALRSRLGQDSALLGIGASSTPWGMAGMQLDNTAENLLEKGLRTKQLESSRMSALADQMLGYRRIMQRGTPEMQDSAMKQLKAHFAYNPTYQQDWAQYPTLVNFMNRLKQESHP